jgi:hypothetical protein
MFILLQLPLVDLRPLIPGERGRLQKPDWNADDPDGMFLRGFGKVVTRNSDAAGLLGERAFADFDNAVRFNFADEHLWYRQQGWEHPVTILPWFRRFYFDGLCAGRFEFGFLVMDETEGYVFGETGASPYLPGVLAKYIESIPVVVHTGDGRALPLRISEASEPLAMAYVAATSSLQALNEFPVAETCPTYVSVGPPTFQMRATRFGPIDVGRDRRLVALPDGRQITLTSVEGANRRNTIVLQESPGEALSEAPEERAVRVLFSHLNSLIYAISHYIQYENEGLKSQLSRAQLRAAVDRMIARLSEFVTLAPPTFTDEEFESAMQAFGRTYAGRVDNLFEQLSELAKSAHDRTSGEKVAEYGKALFELVLTTAVKAITETAAKPS